MYDVKWKLGHLNLCFKTITTLLFIFVILIVKSKHAALLQLPSISDEICFQHLREKHKQLPLLKFAWN